MGVLSRFYFLFLLKLNIHIPLPARASGFSEATRANKYVCGSLACTQAAQAHYMNADLTLACERCCVINGCLQRLVCYVNGFS